MLRLGALTEMRKPLRASARRRFSREPQSAHLRAGRRGRRCQALRLCDEALAAPSGVDDTVRNTAAIVFRRRGGRLFR